MKSQILILNSIQRLTQWLTGIEYADFISFSNPLRKTQASLLSSTTSNSPPDCWSNPGLPFKESSGLFERQPKNERVDEIELCELPISVPLPAVPQFSRKGLRFFSSSVCKLSLSRCPLTTIDKEQLFKRFYFFFLDIATKVGKSGFSLIKVCPFFLKVREEKRKSGSNN